jgi:erythrin-vacuolar iron transport family protein
MSTAQNTALVRPLFEDSNKRNMGVIGQLLGASSVISDRAVPAPGASAVENRAAAGSLGPSAGDQQRAFVLSVVQPGLAGLMDGSISSLAPLFAAAFATRDSHTAFLVGLATAIGAGISMAFSEGLSDDGKLSGRGSPWLRGAVCGLMTFLGAAGHTLPFLLPAFLTAALLAAGVVIAELLLIAWIRNHYMDTPLLAATFQVVVGGVIVFGAGILIGCA